MGLVLVVAGLAYLAIQRKQSEFSWYEATVLLVIGVAMLLSVRKK